MNLETLTQEPLETVKVLGGQGWIALHALTGSDAVIADVSGQCYGLEPTGKEKRKLIKKMLTSVPAHRSPLEFVELWFRVYCPLFVRSQWHRHRTWQYMELSRRYTSGNLEFYVPNPRPVKDAVPLTLEKMEEARASFKLAHYAAVVRYEHLLELGVCKEQARGVLPVNLMTTFWAKVDLNNLCRFLEVRDEDHAQAEIREYAQAIKKMVGPRLPLVAEALNWNY